GAPGPLRVCADPENLPFTSSDPTEKGFYLELAGVIAARLGTTMEPLFFRTDAGLRALRPTLLAGRCDAFFGMPSTAARAPGGRPARPPRPVQDRLRERSRPARAGRDRRAGRGRGPLGAPRPRARGARARHSRPRGEVPFPAGRPGRPGRRGGRPASDARAGA